MNCLALDTSSRIGSVAVLRDTSVVVVRSGDAARTHGERLPLEVLSTLSEASLSVRDIDRLAVAVGPGSFTSLRVGVATIQGLALVRQLPVVPVPTLDAVAAVSMASSPERLLIWMDGQRGDIFAGLYVTSSETATGTAGRCVKGPAAGTAEELLSSWEEELAAGPVVVRGDGIARTAAALEPYTSRGWRLEPEVPPLAPTIGRLALQESYAAVTPHAVHPLYVRRPDAVVARERRASEPAGHGPR